MRAADASVRGRCGEKSAPPITRFDLNTLNGEQNFLPAAHDLLAAEAAETRCPARSAKVVESVFVI
jgi:hypothetical protein